MSIEKIEVTQNLSTIKQDPWHALCAKDPFRSHKILNIFTFRQINTKSNRKVQ